MAITIGPSYIQSSGNMDMRVSTSNIVERFYNGYAGGNDYQPAFNAHGTVGWTYYPSGWNELGSSVGFSPTWYQKGAGSYGMNSNGRYYAPKTGYYYFHCDLYTLNDDNSTANYGHLQFARNGSLGWNNGRVPYTIYGHGNARGIGSAYPHGPNISSILYLSEGQYCSIYWYSPGRGTTRYYGNHSFFCGHLIG